MSIGGPAGLEKQNKLNKTDNVVDHMFSLFSFWVVQWKLIKLNKKTKQTTKNTENKKHWTCDGLGMSVGGPAGLEKLPRLKQLKMRPTIFSVLFSVCLVCQEKLNKLKEKNQHKHKINITCDGLGMSIGGPAGLEKLTKTEHEENKTENVVDHMFSFCPSFCWVSQEKLNKLKSENWTTNTKTKQKHWTCDGLGMSIGGPTGLEKLKKLKNNNWTCGQPHVQFVQFL